MPYNETEEFVLELLYRSRSKIQGKTKFQKIMYILKSEYDERIPELKNLRFRLHYYGPFSRDFDDTLTRLTLKGRLAAERREVIDYYRNDYSLSWLGKIAAKKAYAAEERQRRALIDEMAQEIKELNRQPLETVISKAYSIAEQNGL